MSFRCNSLYLKMVLLHQIICTCRPRQCRQFPEVPLQEAPEGFRLNSDDGEDNGMTHEWQMETTPALSKFPSWFEILVVSAQGDTTTIAGSYIL